MAMLDNFGFFGPKWLFWGLGHGPNIDFGSTNIDEQY